MASFKWPAQGGSGGGVTSLNSETGDINIVAGSNITVTPAGQNITIASGGIASYNNPNMVNVRNYGAVGNGSTDDTTAINNAITAAALLTSPCLWFPYSAAYKIISAIAIPAGIDVQMDGEVIYVGSSNIAAVTIGTTGVSNYGRNLKLSVTRNTLSDWTSESCIGVVLNNLNYSNVVVNNIDRFTINLQCVATGGAGLAYNIFYLGDLANGKVQLDLAGNTAGFPNENLFLGGNFTNSSHPDLQCYGVRIGGDGTYSPNNNHFIKPSFQLGIIRPTGDVSSSVNPTRIINMSSTTSITMGDTVVSGFFAAGTTVVSIDSATQITVSNSSNGTSSGTAINIIKSTGLYVPYGIQNEVVSARVENTSQAMYTINAADFNVFYSFYNSSYVSNIDSSSNPNYFIANRLLPVTALSAVGSSPNANAASFSGFTLNLQPASASFPGVVTAGTQTLAGSKTFSSPVLHSNGSAGSPSISFSSDSATGFLWSAGGSGHLLEWSINGTVGGTFDTNAMQFATTTSTAVYELLRTVNTGSIRIEGGTGSGSGYFQGYGSTHATKPAYVEIGSAGAIAATFSTAQLLTLTGVTTHPAGTVAAPSINFGDTGSGFYRVGTDSNGFASNGVQAGKYDSSTQWTFGATSAGDIIHRLNGRLLSLTGGSAASAIGAEFRAGTTTGNIISKLSNSDGTRSFSLSADFTAATERLFFTSDSTTAFYINRDGTINFGNLSASSIVATNSSKNLVSITYTSANTASTIVIRDGSGNFSAGTITATVTGHSSLDLALTGGTMTGAIQGLNGTAGAPGYSFASDAASGLYWGAGGSGHQVLISNNGQLNADFDTAEVLYATAGSTTAYFMGRTVQTASLQHCGGTGTDAMFEAFGATHATKPAWAEIKSGNAIVASFNATGQCVMKGTTDANSQFIVGNSAGSTGYIRLQTAGTVTDVEVYSPSGSKIMGLGCDNSLGYLLFGGAGNITFDGTTINFRKTLFGDTTNTFDVGGTSNTFRTGYFGTSLFVNGSVASACLAATSTTKGFLPPVMTTTQKNAISSPATGLMVFDSTLAKLSVWTGAAWETVTSV